MDELRAFNEKRAEIYWWISGLFVRELSETELEQYQSDELKTFVEGLGEVPILTEPSDDLLHCISQLKAMEDAQIVLASDFNDLFLSSNQNVIYTCASHYRNVANPSLHTSTQEIVALMASHYVTVDPSNKEPADHISNELDFLGNLIIRSNELEKLAHFEEALTEQEMFIRRYLLSWLYDFREQLNHKDSFGFYASIARLLVCFLELDCEYLATKQRL